jgi:hypothetical protein
LGQQNREDLNIPTQAKIGLEWATVEQWATRPLENIE